MALSMIGKLIRVLLVYQTLVFVLFRILAIKHQHHLNKNKCVLGVRRSQHIHARMIWCIPIMSSLTTTKATEMVVC